MSKGGKNQTTTTAPPAYQLPYLQAGLSRAEQLYSGNTPTMQQPSTSILPTRATGNSGNLSPTVSLNPAATGAAPVAGFTPDQQAAMRMVQNRVGGGDPTISAAQGYVQNTLNGGFLNANPYIDQTFNRAAQASQDQLASQFAGSGRNVDQSAGQRGQQLNDLASQIYGGNYANERQLQQAALGYAQPLGNQAYTDAAQLAGIGQQQQQLQQQQMDAPGTALDQYLARIRGSDYGSTTTQPGASRSPLAGAAGGALTGAKLGSIFPGIGTVIGGIGGGILGGIFG